MTPPPASPERPDFPDPTAPQPLAYPSPPQSPAYASPIAGGPPEPPTFVVAPPGHQGPVPPPYSPVPTQYPPAPPAYAGPVAGFGIPGGAAPPPVARPGYNGFAIASFVLSLVGGVLLSVIFGFVALSNIKRTGQQGRGLAIAGLIISGVWLLLVCAGAVIAVAIGASHPTNASSDRIDTSSRGPGAVSLADLKAGDCVVSVAENVVVRQANTVPCTSPHHGEVVGSFILPGSTYPGDDSVAKQAGDGCEAQLKAYSTAAYHDEAISIFYFAPTSDIWARNKRVVCIAYDENHLRTSALPR